MQVDNKKLIRFFSSRLFTVIVIVVIALVSLAFYKDYQKQADINYELEQLQSEVIDLQEKKIELARLVDILESSNYIEREARLRLGLQKPGEKVISVPENARPRAEVLGSATELASPRPNPLQWFDYFFLKSVE